MPAEISIEDFMKVYISMGAAGSDILPCTPEVKKRKMAQ